MYYVNQEQIAERLAFAPVIAEGAAAAVAASGEGRMPDLLTALTQERLLHLAIEMVTDVGSLMIDGFIMRDASSYEDIVDILVTEGVFDKRLGDSLTELVRLRRPLVQEFYSLDRERLHPMLPELGATVTSFAAQVSRYLIQELGPAQR